MENYTDALMEEYLFEMSTLRGAQVALETIDFSFYFSSKDTVNGQQAIRAKICWTQMT